MPRPQPARADERPFVLVTVTSGIVMGLLVAIFSWRDRASVSGAIGIGIFGFVLFAVAAYVERRPPPRAWRPWLVALTGLVLWLALRIAGSDPLNAVLVSLFLMALLCGQMAWRDRRVGATDLPSRAPTSR